MTYGSRLRGRFLATAAAVFCLVGVASARDLTDAETAKLTDAVAKFDAATEGKDAAALVRAIPPGIIKQMAQRDGVSEDEINKAMADLIGATLQALPIQSLTLKLTDAEHKELADGTPYVLIPTDAVMDAGGADKVLMRAPTLALLEGSEWYMLRSNDAQLVSVLREAYPDYAGVEFPQATMEPFKE